jgi:hypothetical protein
MTKPKSVVETERSVRTAIADEILATMAGGKTLTSNELVDLCPSAHDSTDIGRVIYWLRQNGRVMQDGTRNGVKAWTLVADPAPAVPDPIDAALIMELAKATAADTTPPTETEPMPEFTPPDTSISAVSSRKLDYPPAMADDLSRALADMLDIADEACLEYADSRLKSDPHWSTLRTMQSAAFDAVCTIKAMSNND